MYVGKVDHHSDSVDIQPVGDQVIMDVSPDEEASGTERSNMNEIPRKVKLQFTCTYTTKSRVLTTK